MSAWAPVAAGRTVQRGCEPRAMEPPSKETCEDNSSCLDIGITPGLFNDAPGGGRAEGGALLVAQIRGGLGAERPPGAGEAEHHRQQHSESQDYRERRRWCSASPAP